MGKQEIQTKLRTFLENDSFQHEKDVVYFFVEARKILDHVREEGENIFPVIRFYCDWSLHTSKTRIIEEIQQIMDQISHEELIVNKGPGALTSFINMERLREEFYAFCKYASLPFVFDDDKVWLAFRTLTIHVLSDQPILMSGYGVTSFRIIANEDTYEVQYDMVP